MKLLIAAVLTLWLPAGLFSDSVETSFGIDGEGGYSGLFLYRSRVLDLGLTGCRSAGENDLEFMAGMNAGGFSIGHLDDAGLANEIRNPGAGALSRLSERTFFRADIRSDSRSRMGAVLSGPGGRLGFGLERREAIDAVFALGVPVSSGSWVVEILGEGGNLREPENDEGWYTGSPWQPCGPFGIASTRVRFLPGAFSAGITLMMSGGPGLMPGWMAALSADYSGGPWRIRSRGVMCSPYFRNADGELPDENLGFAADWRYRPSTGFQFAAEYEFALTTLYPDGNVPEDMFGMAAGWRFGETQLSVETDWNRAFFPLTNVDRKSACRRIRGALYWDRDFYHLGLTGDWEPEGESEVQIEFATPLGSAGMMEGSAELYGTDTRMFLGTQIRLIMNVGRNDFISTVRVEDIMQRRIQPYETVADFRVEIRWIRDLR